MERGALGGGERKHPKEIDRLVLSEHALRAVVRGGAVDAVLAGAGNRRGAADSEGERVLQGKPGCRKGEEDLGGPNGRLV